MSSILAVAILIIAGYLGSLLATKIKFPRVTGYLLIGMLLSPSVFRIIPKEFIHASPDIITNVALGIIAYLIGGSLEIKTLRKLKKSLFSITIFQALAAWLFVTLLIVILGPFVIKGNSQFILPLAIVIGAVSCATAPAATIAIIHQYRARGPLTTTLLDVVALDDVVAIIAFAFAIAMADVLVIGREAISLSKMILNPLGIIFGSLILGIILGLLLTYLGRFVKRKQMFLVLVIGIILLGCGLSNLLGLSGLLTNMAVGFMVVNRVRHHQMFNVINDIEELVFAIFFTYAGCHLDFEVMKLGGILAILIVIGRFLGKYLGTRLGATISQAPDVIKKYLGLGLLPKAGVTVGLVLLAQDSPSFSQVGSLMVNAVLASVIINELIAPPLTKYAIFKAGEATLTKGL